MSEKIDKALIMKQLREKLQTDLDEAKAAYETSHKLVTDQELKAEGKYDTRAIEAGYLAGAQKRRLEELEQELALLNEVNLEHTNETASVGSLVEIEFNQMKRWYFISSTSGGSILQLGQQNILVISAFSPIATELIGLAKGESFEVETTGGLRQYQVLSIL